MEFMKKTPVQAAHAVPVVAAIDQRRSRRAQQVSFAEMGASLPLIAPVSSKPGSHFAQLNSA
jgi:hypothetical protein